VLGVSPRYVASGVGLSGVSCVDGFVKSPSAALCFIFRHCSVLLCTPHSSRFARLASGAFYCAVCSGDFLRSHHVFWPLTIHHSTGFGLRSRGKYPRHFACFPEVSCQGKRWAAHPGQGIERIPHRHGSCKPTCCREHTGVSSSKVGISVVVAEEPKASPS
jgi:hypothetical protein